MWIPATGSGGRIPDSSLRVAPSGARTQTNMCPYVGGCTGYEIQYKIYILLVLAMAGNSNIRYFERQ